MGKKLSTPKAKTAPGPSSGPAPSAWERLHPRTRLLALALTLVTLLVFLRAVKCGFVDYDDGDYITANAQVQAGLTWAGVQWAFTTGQASNWHPLTWLSHLLDAELYGLDPAGHHLTSVAFHGLNAGLVFVLLVRLTGSTWRSLLAAGCFAWHPLRVESVAWISERKDVLSFFFGMLALFAYVRYVRESEVRIPKSEIRNPEAAARRPSAVKAYGLALFWFALSLMSKPMFVTLPCVLLLLDYWPLGRVGGGRCQASGDARGGTREVAGGNRFTVYVSHFTVFHRLLLEKLPFFALAAASSVVTFVVQRKGGAVASVTGLPLGARIENTFVAYVRYVFKTVWPADLATLYPHPGYWPTWQVVGAVLLLLGVTALVVVRRRAWPYALVGWLWFVGTLVPVIGLVQVGIQSMADRYTYLPSVGLLIALVWLAHDAASRVRLQPAWAALVAVGCAFGWAGLTWRQIGFWKNTETLFSRAVAVTKDNYLAYNNLGFYLANHGRVAEAITNYQASIRIKPDYVDALNNLGHSLSEQGRHAEALPFLDGALRGQPRHVEMNNNYANALANVGRLEESLRHYETALREKPDHADARNNYGVALAMLGRLDEALYQIRESLRLRPNHAGAHSNLGNALAAARRLDEALLAYRAALRLKPDDAQAHNNLGNVLVERGRLEEAEVHYRRALELNANNPEANFNLAMLLARRARWDEAIRHLREALRLRPNYPEALGALRKLEAQSRGAAPAGVSN
ncbi:MAG TPA: tetratricopeptide repeat protein [Verrucomicrobiae bacterium]